MTLRWRKTARLLAAAVWTVALAASVLASEDGSAGDAAHFLRDGLGARGRGMGSAQVGLGDDFTAPFWNPAPTLQSPSTVVGGGIEQRNRGLFTFSTLGGWLATDTWGAGAVVITSDLYNVYQITGGVRLDGIAFGVGVKGYQFGTPGDRGSGLGLDAGLRYTADLEEARMTLAAVSRDIGWTSIQWGLLETTAVDRVAWVNRLGAALSIPLARGSWEIELDVEVAFRRPPEEGDANYWEQVGEVNVSLGTALEWSGISLRFGVQRFDLSDLSARLRPTVGIGVALEEFAIDIALIPSPLGSSYLGGFQVEL